MEQVWWRFWRSARWTRVQTTKAAKSVVSICSKFVERSPSTFLTLCCCASQLDFASSAGLEWLVTSPPDHDGYHDPGQASVPIDISDTSTLADDDRRGHSDVRVPAGWPAPMRNARKDFAATVVRRGDLFSDQVVVVGGMDNCGALASVEIFDPVDGTWEDLPPLLTARSDCAVAQRVSRVTDTCTSGRVTALSESSVRHCAIALLVVIELDIGELLVLLCMPPGGMDLIRCV